MKLIQKVIIGVLVLALLVFTGVFVLDAYNTGKIGDKAGKIADTFTEDIIGTWTGQYSISKITFKEDGTTSLTMLGIVLNGEYDDSYDLESQQHTIRVKYNTSLGISVERYFKAELKNDTLSLIDTQIDSVKMIYTKQAVDAEPDSANTEKTTVYNPGIDVYQKELLGQWVTVNSQNSGYEFKEDGTVSLKLMGIGYDGTYSVFIDEETNRCMLKISYVKVAGMSINNTYYVTIEDDILTLNQKGAENLSVTYQRLEK